jgi:hypothetical protein
VRSPGRKSDTHANNAQQDKLKMSRRESDSMSCVVTAPTMVVLLARARTISPFDDEEPVLNARHGIAQQPVFLNILKSSMGMEENGSDICVLITVVPAKMIEFRSIPSISKYLDGLGLWHGSMETFD